MRLDTIMNGYLAGLVLARVITREFAEKLTENRTELGWAIGSMETQSVYEMPVIINFKGDNLSDRAIEVLISLGIPRENLFISHGAVYVGFKSHVIRELV